MSESYQIYVQHTMVFLLSTNVETVFPFGHFPKAVDKGFVFISDTYFAL